MALLTGDLNILVSYRMRIYVEAYYAVRFSKLIFVVVKLEDQVVIDIRFFGVSVILSEFVTVLVLDFFVIELPSCKSRKLSEIYKKRY